MKSLSQLFFVWLFCFLGSELFAQQNLFNLPSGDITHKGKVFYQHQFNLYPSYLESKGHFVYGLGRGWDMGLNLVGKALDFEPDVEFMYNSNPSRGALSPHLMLTAQKQFNLSGRFDLNLGVQGGYNLSDELEEMRFTFFNYALGVYHFMDKKSRIVFGAYHTNDRFVGFGHDAGIMLGYEIKLGKRFYLMGDWLSGNHDSGAAVLGAMYNVSKRMQICAGVLIPNPNNDKPMGLVLEFNFLAWDLDLD